MISEQFGGWENLKKKLINASKTLYLSGWVWLVYQQSEKKLLIISTHNQFSPYQFGFEPVMGIDLWEHAYLLSYYNKPTPKLTYVNDLFGFFDWKKIDERFSVILNEKTKKKVS
jgi:Fe-Mn family superoxide dismutase